MTDLPTRARALIEAGERARAWRDETNLERFDIAAEMYAEGIARAYLEALAIVRKMFYANYLERPGAIADARAWVEKQEG